MARAPLVDAGVKWAVRPPAPPAEVEKLARSLSIPPLLASILWSRGLQDEAASYLNPPLALTQIPDLGAAAERLEHALTNKRRILIHGDYDADGISGTAVLTLGLRALGGNVTPFIPNRLNEGYGIYPDRVDEHIANADLFITVDCGISNLDELKRLQDAGVEVIVSDHHQPGVELPDCLIVHPKTSPLAKQGLPELTGAGVAYHLLWALHERLGLEPPVEYSDIASIGTIADVAPLMGENRALIVEGLARMVHTKWPGLRATIRQTKLEKGPTARDVAFILAPRLNAAGRLGEADMGLELLMTASERRARELAVYLDARNTERRKIQDEMFNHALTKVDPDAPALVLDDPGWHPGIMGIVASKILERYYKPVFIIAKGKGSVRSTPGISAVNGLHHAADYLERFGGHSQAAGFAIKEGNVEAFRRSIFDYVERHPVPERVITADALLSSSQIDDDLYRAVCELEPYGEGHPSPQFALTDTLDMARAVGGTKTTLQLRVAGVKGVAWQKGHMASELPTGNIVNTVISLRENFWNDKRSLEFIAEDVRPAEPLGFTEDSPRDVSIFRGEAPGKASIIETPSDIGAASEMVWIKRLPLNSDPLCTTEALKQLLTKGSSFYFDLNVKALYELELVLNQYPSLQDVRRGFVYLQRGQGLPYEGSKAELVEMILRELELLNEQGRPLRGQKRDPYSSETLLTGLLERYKLQTFLNAYKHLDDKAFEQTVATLFSS